MNEKLPVIRQLQDARDHRERADLLLRCCDSVILKYAPVFVEALERAGFEAGIEFVLTRQAFMHAVRDGNGLLPRPLAQRLDDMRAAMARFAAEPPGADPP